MPERLANAGIGRVPRSHIAIEIEIEIDITATASVEQQADKSLPAGWVHADLRMARPFGDAWIRKRRTAVLVVPSVVARQEGNALINPQLRISAGSSRARLNPLPEMRDCLAGDELRSRVARVVRS